MFLSQNQSIKKNFFLIKKWPVLYLIVHINVKVSYDFFYLYKVGEKYSTYVSSNIWYQKLRLVRVSDTICSPPLNPIYKAF